MASFRRGKSGVRSKSTSNPRRPTAGRSAQRTGPRGSSGSHAGPRNPFKASRIDEAVILDPKNPDAIPEISGSDGGLDDFSDLDSSSDSDSGTEKPYSVLLQALTPPTPRGEPKQKKRKIELKSPATIQAGAPKDPDAIAGAEDEDESAEEDAADSEADVSAEGHDFFNRHFADPDEDEISNRLQAVKDNQWVTQKLLGGPIWSAIFRRPIHSRNTNMATTTFKRKFEKAAERLLSNASDLSSQLSSSIFTYQDISFSARSLQNADEIRWLTSVHCLNHIFRTRDKVLKNNTKLSKNDHDEDVEFRDQGFTRPKILVLLPTRQSCVKMIETLMSLCEPEQQENKKRFEESYAATEDRLSGGKPEDFKELFGGNDDDMFRLGLKFTRKAVKFFSQFYNSDMIFASPLGLRTALGNESSKKQDYDFLSSIEVVIVDQAEAILMQNWEHVEYVFEHLNLQPKEAHGCDFSRVRNWYLDGQARYFRQTILLSTFNFPALNKLYTRGMLNVDGKVKVSRTYDGAVMDLGFPIKQTFSRFDFVEPVSEPDDRFTYFATAVLPSLIKAASQAIANQHGILVFIPSYADFVRIRNHLASASSTQHVSFGSISEYTSVKDVSRARSHFFSGRHTVLLYTERAHHFRRYHLKGIRQVIFYGLPENPLFYTEIVGGLLASVMAQGKDESYPAIVRCLFSKLDLLKLERVTGTKRYLSLLSERGDTFDFV
ncbi:MAG: hypothetical protein Q9170_001090 [Blastenia crenularia]